MVSNMGNMEIWSVWRYSLDPAEQHADGPADHPAHEYFLCNKSPFWLGSLKSLTLIVPAGLEQCPHLLAYWV